MITKIVGALALLAEYLANRQHKSRPETGGHQHVEEEFYGVVGAVSTFWMTQSSCNYEGTW